MPPGNNRPPRNDESQRRRGTELPGDFLTLPIDPLLPEIVRAVQSHPAVLITAPPGAGKTTRVPRALLDAGLADAGEIVVLQPRRIAARLAAGRVAEELGEGLGNTVGYAVRFENISGPGTRIRFLTEGVFARQIVQSPLLPGIGVVILDEFHERHLANDLALAYVRLLQQNRPDLKLVVMSATMETDALSDYLCQAPIFAGGHRPFPIAIEYEDAKQSGARLEEKVASAIRKLLQDEPEGDILVFLPGAAEIRRCGEALQSLTPDISVLPLHGDLSSAEQGRAVRPTGSRKIILSTNVAETSVTIPGIAAVVDSGFARVAGHSVWSGLPRLALSRISKASAEQRAGRAGRTRAGRVIRLYSRYDFGSRPERDIPEIRRSDLSETLLTLRGAGIRDIHAFPWLEIPSQNAIHAAEKLLLSLGALDTAGSLTSVGRMMLRFPVHPRLARLIVEGERRGAPEAAAAIAALLSERDIRLDARSDLHGRPTARKARSAASSDVLEILDRFQEAERLNFEPSRIRSQGLDAGAIDRVERAKRQILRLMPKIKKPKQETTEEELLIAILSAFPDRVGYRASAASRNLVMCAGGSATLAEGSVVHRAGLVVAVDAEERVGSSGSSDTQPAIVRLASAVEPEWLADLFPAALESESRLVWNGTGERVDQIQRTKYGQVVIEEIVRPAQLSDATSDLLAAKVIERGLAHFDDPERIAGLGARLELLRTSFPREDIPDAADAAMRSVIRQICQGRRSFAELGKGAIARRLFDRLSGRQRDLLARETPERISLRSGRSVKVHYEANQPPWVASRLQDFMGMAHPPAICAGRVRLTIHLLAPNGRPVQITQDLAGFWEKHYPAIKRELQRRYPKHPWP
jgi:ATP-dependent helicase HrpB